MGTVYDSLVRGKHDMGLTSERYSLKIG